MKKIIPLASLILFSSNLLAQSILLTPNKVESKQSSSADNIILQSTNQPNILGKRQNGTLAAPTTVVTGDDLLSLQASAYNGSAFTGTRGVIRFEASQNWNINNNGSRIKFLTTNNNSTTLTERMIIDHNGKVGLGVSSPDYNLEIQQNADSDNGIGVKRFGSGIDNAASIVGISSRGNINNPNATQNGDILVKFGGRGYNSVAYTTSSARIDMKATQNWNTSATGTEMLFHTTANGSTSLQQRMMITHDGKVGINTSTPDFPLEVLQDVANDNGIAAKRFGGDAPTFFGISARGNNTTPSTTLSGDVLVRFGGRGYAGTGYSNAKGRIDFVANQDWTSTANGTDIKFYTTESSTPDVVEKVIIKGNGNLGIGDTAPTSKLTVNGDYQLSVENKVISGETTFTALPRNEKSIIRLGGDGTVHLKGIGGGVDGLILHIMVTGPVKLKIYLKSVDAASGNKIVFEDENEDWIIDSVKVIHGHGGCILIYDGIDSLWRVID